MLITMLFHLLLGAPLSTEKPEAPWPRHTIDDSSRLVCDFIQSGFGLMPGQNLFIAADDNAAGMLLYATCWPWGDGDKFSLRVGMFSETPNAQEPQATKAMLSEWLNIPKP